MDENYDYKLRDKKSLTHLVSEILLSKDLETFDPHHLTRVGDRLALEVAGIYNSLMDDSPNFTSHFYFDKAQFQENEGEVSVGFQVEAKDLILQLVSVKKRLQVVSIVGMAGLGKTTLARRVFENPYVLSYFHVRAWVTCSQGFQKRDVLLAILSSVDEITDEVCSMNDIELAHNLYRALMDQRYLIVIDDIWSTDAWDDIKSCFPDDNMNGSKIMLTTRLKDIALHAQTDKNPLCLSFLSEEESFDLFRRKSFLVGNFLDGFSVIGKRIIKKCGGLPLAIVAIAGLLNNNLEIHWWKKVENSVSSSIASDESQYMDTLALSYNHLPQNLIPCFLSFGAFSEYQDIPVRKLIWLWIAEGFIHRDGTGNSLEYVAEKYLLDLIRRSLVVVGKRGSNGAIKTCRIHDLFRDLCKKS